MSSHLYRPAYATRLGNLTAKSILVRICDQANDNDGLGWPSVDRISVDTEVNRRTVARIIDVFDAMGLVKKLGPMEVNDRFGRRVVDAMQVDLARLGTDMTEEFARCYAAAQSKVAVQGSNGRWRLRDAEADVSETGQQVSETGMLLSESKGLVSETEPPDPHSGGTLFEPALDPSPNPVARACGLTAEQQEDLDRLAAEGKTKLHEDLSRYYAEENCRRAQEVEAARGVAAAKAAKERELEREYPDLETALTRVRKRCGFAWADGDELGPVLRQVFLDQAEMGKPVWRAASQMVAAWELQRRQGVRLRARYGPMRFFRDGHWLDPAGWHWNVEALERERLSVEAAIGRGCE